MGLLPIAHLLGCGSQKGAPAQRMHLEPIPMKLQNEDQI